MSESTSYVGMDVHKGSIFVAVRIPGQPKPTEFQCPNTVAKTKALADKLRHLCPDLISACYEAGPTGYALAHRLKKEARVTCEVIAPSLIPKKPGERIKTDKRDALKLAEYLEAGLLTVVQTPQPVDEARRELCRARTAAKEDEKRAKHKLSKFFLRQGRSYQQGRLWTCKHMAWVRRQKFEFDHLRIVLDSLILALDQATGRVEALVAHVETASKDEAVKDVVDALKCLKGVKTITAMGVVTELYNAERFRTPRDLMSFLGLIPGEHSSGGQVRRTGITKTGNVRLRKLLVEAAWANRKSARTGTTLAARRRGQPAWAVQNGEKAQERLHRRFWALVNKGKSPNVAVVAVARELVGFIWVALRLQQIHASEAHA